MNRQTLTFFNFARTLPRVILLTAALAAPLFAIQNVQAGSSSIIESNREMSSGAGLVILFGLQRS